MRTLNRVLFIISALIFIVSAFLLVKSLLEYKEGDDIYSAAIDKFVVPSSYDSYSSDVNSSSTKNEDTPPVKVKEPAISIDFDSLVKINKDVLGWIYIPNTVVSYPLLAGVDNSKYLYKTYDHKYNKFGSIFTDMYNKNDLSSQNTIIYGHNIHNGSMFSSILNYENQVFYEKHKNIYILTPTGYKKYEVFSAYLTSTYGNVYFKDELPKDKFFDYLDVARKNSKITSDLIVTNTDKIITLSTCESTTVVNDKRFVVHAKLVKTYVNDDNSKKLKDKN